MGCTCLRRESRTHRVAGTGDGLHRLGGGSGLKNKKEAPMNGKRPTKRQKHLLRLRRLNPDKWLVIRNLLHEGELHIKNRESGRERIIKI